MKLATVRHIMPASMSQRACLKSIPLVRSTAALLSHDWRILDTCWQRYRAGSRPYSSVLSNCCHPGASAHGRVVRQRTKNNKHTSKRHTPAEKATNVAAGIGCGWPVAMKPSVAARMTARKPVNTPAFDSSAWNVSSIRDILSRAISKAVREFSCRIQLSASLPWLSSSHSALGFPIWFMAWHIVLVSVDGPSSHSP